MSIVNSAALSSPSYNKYTYMYIPKHILHFHSTSNTSSIQMTKLDTAHSCMNLDQEIWKMKLLQVNFDQGCDWSHFCQNSIFFFYQAEITTS